MTRSFTELYSNKLFVSRLASPEMLNFISSRPEFSPGNSLQNVTFEERVDPTISADLIHEVCHAWCFDSHVGKAISLIDLRTRLAAVAYPKSVPDRSDVLRSLSSQALMTPLAEGLALFTEFDVWRSEIQSDARTPINLMEIFLSHSGLESSQKDFFVDRMLETVRNDPNFVRRKTNFYLMPFDVVEGYVPGYMAIKNLSIVLSRAFPEIKQETVLTFFKEYFWNDPVLARMILTGPEPKPSFEDLDSEEYMFEVNAGVAKMDPLEMHREIFRRFEYAKTPFNLHAVYKRLAGRINALHDDKSLGARLGAIQSRLEHGIGREITWETQTTEREHLRFKAVELELRGYAFNFFKDFKVGGAQDFSKRLESEVQTLSSLIAFLPEYRRISPLLVAQININKDRKIKARFQDEKKIFDVVDNRFFDHQPGFHTFFLAVNAKNLEFASFLVPYDESPPKGPIGESADRFYSGTESLGHADSAILFGQLFFKHLMMTQRLDEFEQRVAGVPEIEEYEGEILSLSKNLYLQAATLLLNVAPDEHGKVTEMLIEKGLRAFLPKKLSLIERAAMISLLTNAAAEPHEFAMYMSLNLNEGLNLELDALIDDMKSIFESDPHQLLFRRRGEVILWAI